MQHRHNKLWSVVLLLVNTLLLLLSPVGCLVVWSPCRSRRDYRPLSRCSRVPLSSIVESDFPGAGSRRPQLEPHEIPPLLMEALKFNDFPSVDAGLRSVWEFSSDTTKFVFQNNGTDFIQSAHETARTFPTSFYGAAMNGLSWEMETKINRVGGPNGWIATQVMKTISCDGRLRRWQWELRKQRRPPNQGCWYVENIGSSDRQGQFEPE